MENNIYEINNTTKMTEDVYYESAKMILRRKSKRNVIIFLSAVTVVYAALIMIVFFYEINTISIIALCVLVIFWLMIILFFIDLLTFKNRRIYRKQIKNAHARIYNYTFDDKYIKAVWQTGTSTVFYNQISAIYETKKTYIIISDQNPKIRESFVIDKRGFSSSSYDDFTRFLRERVTIPIKS